MSISGAVSKWRSPTQPHKEGRTIGTSNTQTRSNGKGQAAEYVEDADWGSAFHRPDNEPPRPKYTGSGVLDKETLIKLYEGGGEFQISVWPRRARNGSMYLRVHIELPYQGSEDAELDESEFQGNAAEPEPTQEAGGLPWS